MYPEFIPIYIGLIVIIALLVLVTILVLVLKRSNNSVSVPKNISASNPATTEAGSIVFCKNCATQFDSNAKCCPKCGTPR